MNEIPLLLGVIELAIATYAKTDKDDYLGRSLLSAMFISGVVFVAFAL